MSNISKEVQEKIRKVNSTPCIIKTKDGDFVKFEDKCIIFDNPAQAGDYVRKHPELADKIEFGNAVLSCIEYEKINGDK